MMLPYHYKKQLIQKSTLHLTRKRLILKQEDEKIFYDNKKLINFASNDYLNLRHDSRIKRALNDHIKQEGFGSGASAHVSGYTRIHEKLEKTLAESLNRERALLFNSGYHANLSLLSSFAARKTQLFLDKSCHASLIDGALLSRAALHRYSHQNMNHLQQLLAQKIGQKIIVTESIFSIQGDLTPLCTVNEVAKQHQAILIVDDAHGFGVLGTEGRGALEHWQLPETSIQLLTSTFGKALGGLGAVVTGEHDWIEFLLQTARPYFYSTSLPPLVCHANLAALKVLIQETFRREQLTHLIKFFNQQAKLHGLSLANEDLTPIRAIFMTNAHEALLIQRYLLERGFLIAIMRPPTSSPLLRISLTTAHTEKDIQLLIDHLINYSYASPHSPTV